MFYFSLSFSTQNIQFIRSQVLPDLLLFLSVDKLPYLGQELLFFPDDQSIAISYPVDIIFLVFIWSLFLSLIVDVLPLVLTFHIHVTLLV